MDQRPKLRAIVKLLEENNDVNLHNLCYVMISWIRYQKQSVKKSRNIALNHNFKMLCYKEYYHIISQKKIFDVSDKELVFRIYKMP